MDSIPIADLPDDVLELIFKESITEAEMKRLLSYVCEKPNEDEDKILSYLQSGLNVTACTLFLDHLDSHKWVTSYAIYSDGVWAWSNALAYYVGCYHFRLPFEFVAHMKSRDWIPPKRETLDGQDIVDRYFLTNERSGDAAR